MLTEREEYYVTVLDRMIADEIRASGEYGKGHADGWRGGLKSARDLIAGGADEGRWDLKRERSAA